MSAEVATGRHDTGRFGATSDDLELKLFASRVIHTRWPDTLTGAKVG